MDEMLNEIFCEQMYQSINIKTYLQTSNRNDNIQCSYMKTEETIENENYKSNGRGYQVLGCFLPLELSDKYIENP